MCVSLGSQGLLSDGQCISMSYKQESAKFSVLVVNLSNIFCPLWELQLSKATVRCATGAFADMGAEQLRKDKRATGTAHPSVHGAVLRACPPFPAPLASLWSLSCLQTL